MVDCAKSTRGKKICTSSHIRTGSNYQPNGREKEEGEGRQGEGNGEELQKP